MKNLEEFRHLSVDEHIFLTEEKGKEILENKSKTNGNGASVEKDIESEEEKANDEKQKVKRI